MFQQETGWEELGRQVRRKKEKKGQEFARNLPPCHALHNASYKPYRADFADATRAVLRLVERHSRHSTTALNRQSLSSLFLCLASAPPLFRARSLAVANRVLFSSERSTRLAATRRDATRRDSRRPLSSTSKSDFISSGTSLVSRYRVPSSLSLSLSVYCLALSLLPGPPQSTRRITRRNPLPCRLRPILVRSSRRHPHSLT